MTVSAKNRRGARVGAKVAIVVQRYGSDVVGGAEHHARTLAEKLSADLGLAVTVFTTRATSYRTWANALSAGRTNINGVTVLRFPTTFCRFRFFDQVSPLVLRLIRWTNALRLPAISRCLERLWLILQGPFCPSLIKSLEKQSKQFDLIIFFTYLYYPTIYGLPKLIAKTLLIPTAHNEPAFFFHATRRLLKHAQRIFVNSTAEERLVRSRAPHNADIRIVGLGINESSFRPTTARGDFVLYLGRISRGKGVDALVRDFLAANHKTTLILAGQQDEGFAFSPDARVKYVGFLSEEEKMDYIKKARCIINPSGYESLSLIVLEGAACQVPLLLNGHCEIFRDYAQAMPAADTYCTPEEFTERLNSILETDWDAPENRKRLEKGREWVLKHYGWEAILKEFSQAIHDTPGNPQTNR